MTTKSNILNLPSKVFPQSHLVRNKLTPNSCSPPKLTSNLSSSYLISRTIYFELLGQDTDVQLRVSIGPARKEHSFGYCIIFPTSRAADSTLARDATIASSLMKYPRESRPSPVATVRVSGVARLWSSSNRETYLSPGPRRTSLPIGTTTRGNSFAFTSVAARQCKVDCTIACGRITACVRATCRRDRGPTMR